MSESIQVDIKLGGDGILKSRTHPARLLTASTTEAGGERSLTRQLYKANVSIEQVLIFRILNSSNRVAPKGGQVEIGRPFRPVMPV